MASELVPVADGPLASALLVTRTTDRKLDEPSWRVFARRDADTLDESVMVVLAGRCDAGVDAVLSLDEARALAHALLLAATPTREGGTPTAQPRPLKWKRFQLKRRKPAKPYGCDMSDGARECPPSA